MLMLLTSCTSLTKSSHSSRSSSGMGSFQSRCMYRRHRIFPIIVTGIHNPLGSNSSATFPTTCALVKEVGKMLLSISSPECTVCSFGFFAPRIRGLKLHSLTAKLNLSTWGCQLYPAIDTFMPSLEALGLSTFWPLTTVHLRLKPILFRMVSTCSNATSSCFGSSRPGIPSST